MGGMMPSVRTNLAHKRYDYRALSWLQNLNVSFPQRRFPFFSRTFPATRARGSRDLRPRVTRPAPAGHATRGRGSLAICRSETGTSLGKPAFPRGRTYHWLAIAVKPSKHRNYSGGIHLSSYFIFSSHHPLFPILCRRYKKKKTTSAFQEIGLSPLWFSG